MNYEILDFDTKSDNQIREIIALIVLEKAQGNLDERNKNVLKRKLLDFSISNSERGNIINEVLGFYYSLFR